MGGSAALSIGLNQSFFSLSAGVPMATVRATAQGLSTDFIPELVQSNDAFVCDVPAGNDPQAQQALLKVGDLTQPLQALVVDVDALAKSDFLNVLQAVCF